MGKKKGWRDRSTSLKEPMQSGTQTHSARGKPAIASLESKAEIYSAKWFAATNYGKYLDSNFDPICDETGNVIYEEELRKLRPHMQKFGKQMFKWAIAEAKKEVQKN